MISGVLLSLLGAAAFILVLSFLVFFHELGHYSMGRLFKIDVEKFSIGFGKPLVKWTAKSGTQWSISRIPLGGYVKFAGDAGAASNPDQEKLAQIKAQMEEERGEGAFQSCFHFKPLWQRTLVVLAGPIANFILSIIIFAGFFMIMDFKFYKPEIGSVVEGSAAEAAGFEIGDLIVSINGKPTPLTSDVQQIISLNAEETMTVNVLRDGKLAELTVVPKRIETKDMIGGQAKIGRIGVAMPRRDDLLVQPYGGVLGPLNFGASKVGDVIVGTGTYVGRIFTAKEDGKALGGVARIAAMTAKTATDSAKAQIPIFDRFKLGLARLLELAALLSIGLGVANLMPIPVLDGGHLVYYGYEAIAGRALSAGKQELGFKIGLSVLLGLFVILTWNDIGYVRSLFT